MADNYVFAIEGLDSLSNFDELKPKILRAAYRAINATSDRARTWSANEMRRQVNFPAGYLRGADSRLRVTQRASSNKLEGIITGRQRATSLARFVTGKTGDGKGLRLTVKPGAATEIKGAFLMPLRGGTRDPGRNGNVGLAVRTARGQRPSKAYKPVRVSENLWLLYGPSVDQVFKSVREDVRPEVEAYLDKEFQRLLAADL